MPNLRVQHFTRVQPLPKWTYHEALNKTNTTLPATDFESDQTLSATVQVSPEPRDINFLALSLYRLFHDPPFQAPFIPQQRSHTNRLFAFEIPSIPSQGGHPFSPPTHARTLPGLQDQVVPVLHFLSVPNTASRPAYQPTPPTPHPRRELAGAVPGLVGVGEKDGNSWGTNVEFARYWRVNSGWVRTISRPVGQLWWFVVPRRWSPPFRMRTLRVLRDSPKQATRAHSIHPPVDTPPS
ncbi:hypothetical protein MKZ38_001014 [Zalerion maritima]|uniref:Uncharacterized protein n=1 Tax=Zalerion maritima TaxID=339359 RepID=A0AAD5RYJ4_9PEZI|nr:hypothetical protein MKZ38_001014 [Zalerion maritima]